MFSRSALKQNKALFSVIAAFVFFPNTLSAAFDYKIENSNFTISQNSEIQENEESYLYNYDRLRFEGSYTEDGFFISIIADGVHYFGNEYINADEFALLKQIESDTPFKTQSSYKEYENGAAAAKIYRLYGGYEDAKNRVVAGLQNISMGVGRIWTPTNSFNPKNIYALESDETFGIYGVLYTRHLDEMSDVSVVVSQKEDESLKYAFRYKTFFEFADMALNLVSSKDTQMLGYEIEGNLADTGVELRSEGAFIKSVLKDVFAEEEKEFFQGIIGADYGFENGVILTTELLYTSKTFTYEEMLLNRNSEILSNLAGSNYYGALSASYSFNLFLDGSLIYIKGFKEQESDFLSPTLTYTLNNYNAFTLGALLQNSRNKDFRVSDERFYLKWSLAF
jgi:hypothetical protein